MKKTLFVMMAAICVSLSSCGQTITKTQVSKVKEQLQQKKTEKETGVVVKTLSADTPTDKILSSIIGEFKGKVVVIDFWATWCGPCMFAMKQIDPIKEKYLEDNKDSIEALRIIYNSEDTVITHSMLSELRDRLLSESRQYGVYQIWKNYKVLDTEGNVDELDVKTNVNALTNLIQIVRYAYKKNQKLTSLISGYAKRFALYCGQQQRMLTEDQVEIMKQVAEFVINDGAISVKELNEIDTDLWRKGVSSFGGKMLAEEMQALSKFLLKVA